jgi:hypothetical protein
MAKSRRPPAGPLGEHPGTDELIASLAGETTPAIERSLTSHTSRCRFCLQRVRSLSIILRAGTAPTPEPIPDELRRMAGRIFDTWRGQVSDSAAAPRRVFASESRSVWSILRVRLAPPLLSWSQMAFPPGFRSVAAPARCELEGGGYRVEIEWTTSGRISTLRGRLVREREDAEDRPALALEFSASAPRRVSIGPRGFFGPVPAPTSRLRAILTTAQRTYRSRWLALT